jgi:Lipocalin-like domain
MKNGTLIMAVLLVCNGIVYAQSEAEIRDRIVGTWKLVSTEQTLKDGTTRPYPEYGPHGKGVLMYSRDGYMCADLVNPDRPKWVDPLHPTTEEKIAAADDTFAYCGRYEIDVKNSRLVHLPEVATERGFEGSRQIRPYKFEDGLLVLGGAETEIPDVVRWKIVWEKVR